METSIRMKQVHENFLMSEFDELERMTAYETEASAQKGVKSYLEGMFIDGYLATYYLLGIEVPDKLVDSSVYLNAKIGGEDYKSKNIRILFKRKRHFTDCAFRRSSNVC